MTRDRLATVVKVTAALALVVVLLAAAGWRASGGRWFDVRTGSMGQAATVGALLLTKPVAVGDLSVGDLVSFREPGSQTVYTHRVAAVDRAGVRTKGDVNAAADPWVLQQSDIIGRVDHVWPVVGFVLRGLPFALVVLGLVWALSLVLRRRWRAPVRVVGASLAFAVACFLVQPWVGLDRVGVTGGSDGATMEAVSTGLLPVRAEIAHEPVSSRVTSGQVVDVSVPSDGSAYHVDAVPYLFGWWWLLVVGICLAPLLGTVLLGVREGGRREAGA